MSWPHKDINRKTQKQYTMITYTHMLLKGITKSLTHGFHLSNCGSFDKKNKLFPLHTYDNHLPKNRKSNYSKELKNDPWKLA